MTQYFAQIDKNTNLVTQVIVADLAFIVNTLPHREGYTWIPTSYQGLFFKNYAGIGYTWDSTRQAFIPPKPYPSWVLNEQTCLWDPPVARPGNRYIWDEPTLSWIAV